MQYLKSQPTVDLRVRCNKDDEGCEILHMTEMFHDLNEVSTRAMFMDPRRHMPVVCANAVHL